ncbi:hypothetical protein MMC11_004056 [Xylographa trunciseda]|nr:hypothetical protein [Xylographa trunciseda]
MESFTVPSSMLCSLLEPLIAPIHLSTTLLTLLAARLSAVSPAEKLISFPPPPAGDGTTLNYALTRELVSFLTTTLVFALLFSTSALTLTPAVLHPLPQDTKEHCVAGMIYVVLLLSATDFGDDNVTAGLAVLEVYSVGKVSR